MRSPRDVRRCAIQALYQFDCGSGDLEAVRASLERSPGDAETHRRGFELAQAAWREHERADEAVVALTPQWPTHRQPAMDRSILRLAYYEMISGTTPPKVAINEAVELAKEYSTEKSPLFINGVLDKIFKSIRKHEPDQAEEVSESEPTG